MSLCPQFRFAWPWFSFKIPEMHSTPLYTIPTAVRSSGTSRKKEVVEGQDPRQAPKSCFVQQGNPQAIVEGDSQGPLSHA